MNNEHKKWGLSEYHIRKNAQAHAPLRPDQTSCIPLRHIAAVRLACTRPSAGAFMDHKIQVGVIREFQRVHKIRCFAHAPQVAARALGGRLPAYTVPME